MKKGIELIANERQRQIEGEGWTLEHDLQHTHGELANAAACYAMTANNREKYQSLAVNLSKWFPRWWPWSASLWKPTPNDRIKELVKAGALIAAEIDRLNDFSGYQDKVFDKGLSPAKKGLLVDAVNQYFHHAHNILQKEDLGDIERNVWQNVKTQCAEFLEGK